jgi:hypothetical protein
VARQGKQKEWSFAHESGADCAGAVESALHKAAKQVFEDEKSLFIGHYDPIIALHPHFSNDIRYAINTYPQMKDCRGPVETSFYRLAKEELVDRVLSARKLCAINSLKFTSVVTEVRAEGSERIPDATATTSNGNRLYVEFVVTNECDEVKIEELRRLGVPTIQIDLKVFRNYEFTLDDIREAVVNGKKPVFQREGLLREWLVKPKYIQDAEAVAQEFIDAVTIKMAGWKEEEKAKLAAIEARRSKLLFMNAMVVIDQRETWATVWMPPSTRDDVLEVLTDVMVQLKATRLTSYWSVRGKNVKERFLEVAERCEQEERNRIEADKQRLVERAALKRQRMAILREEQRAAAELEGERQAEARRLYDLEERKRSVQEREEEKALQAKHKVEQAIAKERQERLTAEILERHKGIVDHRWRRKCINDDLKALGYAPL